MNIDLYAQISELMIARAMEELDKIDDFESEEYKESEIIVGKLMRVLKVAPILYNLVEALGADNEVEIVPDMLIELKTKLVG